MPALSQLTTVNHKEASIRFAARRFSWDILIESAVVHHLVNHRQLLPENPEVGGQLFGIFEKDRVRVSLATGPRHGDQGSRFSFFPRRSQENAEIKRCFRMGLHYLGDWHTHPECNPSPSSIDLASMVDCFRKSKHQLSHFIMLIVGQDELPNHWWVSAHDAGRAIRLKPIVSNLTVLIS